MQKWIWRGDYEGIRSFETDILTEGSIMAIKMTAEQ